MLEIQHLKQLDLSEDKVMGQGLGKAPEKLPFPFAQKIPFGLQGPEWIKTVLSVVPAAGPQLLRQNANDDRSDE